MRLNIPTLATALTLATKVAGDSMVVWTYCFTLACSYPAQWNSAYGSFNLEAHDGCQGPNGVPGLQSLCIDWQKERLHFYFPNQPKRCMKVVNSDWETCGADRFENWTTCSIDTWDEVACTW